MVFPYTLVFGTGSGAPPSVVKKKNFLPGCARLTELPVALIVAAPSPKFKGSSG
jgi:hypothetical protein